MTALTGEIVVNTDASVALRPDAVWRLVAALSDPRVGVSSGRDISVAAVGAAAHGGEAAYVGYEMWVRDLETDVEAIVGSSGCLYAVRAEPAPAAAARISRARLLVRALGTPPRLPRRVGARCDLLRSSRRVDARGVSKKGPDHDPRDSRRCSSIGGCSTRHSLRGVRVAALEPQVDPLARSVGAGGVRDRRGGALVVRRVGRGRPPSRSPFASVRPLLAGGGHAGTAPAQAVRGSRHTSFPARIAGMPGLDAGRSRGHRASVWDPTPRASEAARRLTPSRRTRRRGHRFVRCPRFASRCGSRRAATSRRACRSSPGACGP